jgi:hypothetical protein
LSTGGLILSNLKGGKMKKTWLCVAILLVAFSSVASAQTGAGAMWIGGTAGFTSRGGDLYGQGDERATSFSLDPIVNYFVAPNLFIGPVLSLARSSAGDNSDTDLGIGVRIGYAFGSKGSKSIPYLSSAFKFTSSNYKSGSDESKSSGTSIVLGGGVCFLVAKHAGINVEAGYHIDSYKPKDADKSISGNIISVGVGVTGIIY